MTSLSDFVSVRDMREGDLNFIRSSWLRSNARTVPQALVPSDAYFELHWEVAMGLLERPAVRCVMATDPNDDDHLVGWACGEPAGAARRPLLHFAYVKKPFRRHGVARLLVERAVGAQLRDVTATHLPTEGLRQKLELRGWVFRPQFAFYLAAEAEKGAA